VPQNFQFKKNFIRDHEEYLLERLKKARRVGPNNSTAIAWDESYFFSSIFRSNIFFKTDIDEDVAARIIRSSIGQMLRDDNLELVDFENICREQYDIFLTKPLEQYEVISGLYYRGKNPFQSIHYQGMKMSFLAPKSPKISSHKRLIRNTFPEKEGDLPHVRYLCCKLSERDFHLAFKKAEKAILQIRAVMNLCIGSGAQIGLVYRGTGFGKSKIRESEFLNHITNQIG